mmetsp:Transcript_81021/g.227210  ORF Transcript_81021/g.227210 Transcript_81021/m.227210 type:complete len:239 (+) Transcript_81021:677-1393(+)
MIRWMMLLSCSCSSRHPTNVVLLLLVWWQDRVGWVLPPFLFGSCSILVETQLGPVPKWWYGTERADIPSIVDISRVVAVLLHHFLADVLVVTPMLAAIHPLHLVRIVPTKNHHCRLSLFFFYSSSNIAACQDIVSRLLHTKSRRRPRRDTMPKTSKSARPCVPLHPWRHPRSSHSRRVRQDRLRESHTQSPADNTSASSVHLESPYCHKCSDTKEPSLLLSLLLLFLLLLHHHHPAVS